MTIIDTIECEGTLGKKRLYGARFAFEDRHIQAMGFHWDEARRLWVRLALPDEAELWPFRVEMLG